MEDQKLEFFLKIKRKILTPDIWKVELNQNYKKEKNEYKEIRRKKEKMLIELKTTTKKTQ